MADPANTPAGEPQPAPEPKRRRRPSAGSRALADQLRRDAPGTWTDNRLEQSAHYTGITAVAIRAVMDAVGSCTVRVTRRRKKKPKPGKAGKVKGTVTKALPTPHAHANDQEWVPVTDPNHSLAKLLDRPNPTETIQDVLAQLLLQYHLTGSALLWANPDRLGLPAELYVLPTALCFAQPPTPDYPSGWWRVTQYYPSGAFGILPSPVAGGGSPIDGDEVFRFKNPHPLWRWDAHSALTAGRRQLDILESIDQARWTAMDAGVTPSMMLLAPGLDQQQLDAALDKIAENNAGKRNYRKILGLGGEQGDDKWSVSFPDATAKDMDFSSGWDQMVGFALALFGVPKAVAGLAGTGSYAELYAALKQFYTLTLKPLCARLAAWLTRNLANVWGRDYAIHIDLPTIDDHDQQEKELGTDLQYGLISVNEVRALRNRPAWENGDLPPDAYKAWLQQKMQPQQPPGGGGRPGADGGGGGNPGQGGGPQAGGDQQPDALAALAQQAQQGQGQQPQDPGAAVLGALGVQQKAWNPAAHPRIHGHFAKKGAWEAAQSQGGGGKPSAGGSGGASSPAMRLRGAGGQRDPRIEAYKYLRQTGKEALEAVSRVFGPDLATAAGGVQGGDPSQARQIVQQGAPAVAKLFGVDDEEAREILQAAFKVMATDAQQQADGEGEGDDDNPDPADAQPQAGGGGQKPPAPPKQQQPPPGDDEDGPDSGVPSIPKPANPAGKGSLPPRMGKAWERPAFDKGLHKFCSTQVELPREIAARVLAMGEAIPDRDLAEDGREDRPHVTVRYGLHDGVSKGDVARVVAGTGPVRLHLGKVSVFRGTPDRDYDVVKVDVASPDLHRLHGMLGALPHTDTHPVYHPHATIAYVRRGLGEHYARMLGACDLECVADRLVFSDCDRRRASVPLVESTRVEKAAMSCLVDSAGGSLVAPASMSVGEPVPLMRGLRRKKKRRKLTIASVVKSVLSGLGGVDPLAGWSGDGRDRDTPDIGGAVDALLAEKGYAPAYLKGHDWDENKHPRDHGKFASKPGAGASADSASHAGTASWRGDAGSDRDANANASTRTQPPASSGPVANEIDEPDPEPDGWGDLADGVPTDADIGDPPRDHVRLKLLGAYDRHHGGGGDPQGVHVYLEERKFEFGGAEHPCYRWAAKDADHGGLVDRGGWTLDKARAAREGQAHLDDATNTFAEPDAGGDDPHESDSRRALRRAAITAVANLGGGQNDSKVVTLDDGSKAVFKPAAGEMPGLRFGVPAGGYYAREAAASGVADALGFGDLVPPTTVRELHKGERGSVQAFVPDAAVAMSVPRSDRFDGDHDLARAAAFDYLIGHSDRHGANWLLHGGKLALIDNGLSFPTHHVAEDYWNGHFWPRTIQKRLAVPDLSHLKDHWPHVERAMRASGVTDESAISLTRKRFETVVAHSGQPFETLPSFVKDGESLKQMVRDAVKHM